ncbi:MAG: ATP-binding protein [Planctomycetota bacterium]
MDKVLDRISLTSHTRHLKSVRQFIADVAERGAVPQNLINGIMVAVDEAVANIMEHAYSAEGGGVIEIEVSVSPERFQIEISDTGCPFDPSVVPTPDIREHLAQGRRDGLGIFLIRKIMDEVAFDSPGGRKNHLRMVKYLNKTV